LGLVSNNAAKKLIFMCLLMITAFSVITGALFYWQIIASDKLQRKALGQWTTTTTVAASRGTIYDSTGEILAVSAASLSLYVRPIYIAKTNVSINDLAEFFVSVLGEEYSFDTVYKKIKYIEGENTGTYVIARHLTDEQAEQIKNSAYYSVLCTEKVKSIELVDDVKRYYPKGATLTQVLGSCNVDGVGSDGLELKYDKELRGLTGKLISATDVDSGVPGSEQRYIDATNGLNLKLTVNYAIQSFAEAVSSKCLEETQAKAVRCIVMNPNTGAVLAMVNLPSVDPNTATGSLKLQYSKNSCVLDTYEPGSTFKIFTLSAALEEGTVTKESSFYCPGYHIVDGEKIKCWRTVPHGTQSLQEAICNSCNPAFMQMGLTVGQSKLYEYLYSFGFSSVTNIDFSSDQSGIIMAPKYVQSTDLARISFGQSIAVTPLQLITAACAVINGGTLYQPYFVDSLIDNDGETVTKNSPIAVRQVISSSTSATMRELLEGVVSSGGGKNAQVSGYRIGGKTGTAQKYSDGVIVSGVHIGSFFGFAPANNPQFAVLITVDEAQIANDYGSNTAAPYAGELMQKILQYMQIQPAEASSAETVTVPNFYGMSCDAAESKARQLSLQLEFDGEGTVISQSIPFGKEVEKYTIIKVKGDTANDTTVFYGID